MSIKKEYFDKIAEHGQLIVISGPVGTGKEAVIEQYLKEHPHACVCTQATTRDPREGEVDGKDFHFMSIIEFERMIRTGQMLEYSYIDKKAYGTTKKTVDIARAEGRNVILDADVVSAMRVRAICPDAILIFVLPPSWQALEESLTKCGRYDEDRINELMNMAEEDLACANLYDYIIFNEDTEKAVSRIAQIIHGHRYSSANMAGFLESYIRGEIQEGNKAVSDILNA